MQYADLCAIHFLANLFIVDYLIQPPWHDGILIHSPRPGAAVGILVILYLLVIVFMISYIRVVVLVMLNPDYLPLGPARDSKVEEMEKEKTAAITPTSDNAFPCDEQGLLAFYTRDIYITDSNGRPVWCSNCCQFKSDRAHHCGELNRCVAKMDHFCPWSVNPSVADYSYARQGRRSCQRNLTQILYSVSHLLMHAHDFCCSSRGGVHR